MIAAPEGWVYVPDFLSPEQQAALLGKLQSLDYRHDTHRGQRLKRAHAQFGYAYAATGRKLERAAEFPDFLRALIDQARAYYEDGPPLNQCMVTRYPPGAGIGWHVDARRFAECILGISLGGPARFQFGLQGTKQACWEVKLLSGSLYAMRGPARWNFEHQVPPVKVERYSLTFRHVTGD